ncbi:MAG TPA: hypothetical protein VFG79_24315 [Solirubrobacter sp.]|nr:hypothetical protein [Solirubrobacter sp.]
MLDMIRAYASERFALEVDDRAVRANHYRYYLALAEHHGTERALWGADGAHHLAQLDAESDNLHSALGWAIESAEVERALTLVAALGCYWITRARYAEALDWVDQALRLPGTDAQPALRVRALGTKATCLWHVGRGSEQPVVASAMEADARQLGDPVLISRALQLRSALALNADQSEAATAYADDALHWSTVAGDEWEIAGASRARATSSTTLEDLRERVETAASLLTSVGNVRQLASLLTSAAYAALCLGSERDAAVFAARATPVARTLSSPFERMINSGNAGLAALFTGDTVAASHAFRDELALCRELVVRPVAFEGLLGLAALAVLDGEDTRAATLVGAAAAHRYDNPEDRVEVRLETTFFDRARARVGTVAWDEAAREGGALSFEDAIAYALEEPPAHSSAPNTLAPVPMGSREIAPVPPRA